MAKEVSFGTRLHRLKSFSAIISVIWGDIYDFSRPVSTSVQGSVRIRMNEMNRH